MTTDEIKDLIASKIAGQGSAVDAGSALPEILNGIVDAIEESPAVPEGLEVDITGWQYGAAGEHLLTNEETALLKNAVRVKINKYYYLRQSLVSDEFINYILLTDEVRFFQPNKVVAVFSDFGVELANGNVASRPGFYYVWILDGNNENIWVQVDAN